MRKEDLKMDAWKKKYLRRLFSGFGISALMRIMGLIDGIFELAALSFIMTTLLYVVDISETLDKEG